MARRYVLRHAGFGLLIFSCAAIYGVIGLFSEMGALFPDARIIPTVALVLGVGYLWLWYRRYQAIAGVCKSKAGWTATVRLDEQAITVEYPELSSKIHWSRVCEMWQFPDVIFLFTEQSRNWYMFLPTLAMTREQQLFIEAKVVEHGGRVE